MTPPDRLVQAAAEAIHPRTCLVFVHTNRPGTDSYCVSIARIALAAAFAALPAPHYTSTACHHDQHHNCRLTCKFCNEECLCKCHDREKAAREFGEGT